MNKKKLMSILLYVLLIFLLVGQLWYAIKFNSLLIAFSAGSLLTTIYTCIVMDTSNKRGDRY
jgi:hypothetical protein